MNHVYILVWNTCTGVWEAVGENARSRGKNSGRAASKTFMAALIASGFVITPALAELPATTVVPTGGKTNAYISANGVPVVNIETANAAGLSHNRYTTYNVEAKGLVLNNGNNSQIARQSQLAGQVVANLNLVQEAKIILNEVVSTNRSVLAGFTEVLGGRADVVVANPNGITCNGCGFINTDRVTLTTGTPSIGGAGNLTGFTVNQGDVLIEGVGANANTQQIFDLVARSVKVDGKINTIADGSLGITTGNNVWDYANRNVTGAVAGVGATPAYAIDSTVLGGMYAGRIRLIATEAGVGVRMLGDAAASADDFTLSSAGKIEIQSAVSAARDASITTTSSSGTQDLFLNGATAKLSAGHDLAISATTGQIKLSEGELYAANNLALTGATLTDASTAAKTRFAGTNSTLTTSGLADVNGGVWGAGSALSGTFDSLSIGSAGATIYAGTTLGINTTNDLSLATAALRSAGDMTLGASAGAITAAAGAAQGIQVTTGNLSLSAGNGLTNAGTITADTGSVTARINGTLANSGMLHAKTTLDIADKTNSSTENISNTGKLIADGRITAKAASFTNIFGATVQGATGTTLGATTLSNAGTFIASDVTGSASTLTLETLDNSGTLQAIGSATFNLKTSLSNSGDLLITEALTLRGTDAGYTVSNTNWIQSGGLLDIKGQSGGNGVDITVGGSGVLLGEGMDVNAGTLTVNNGGMVSSAGDMNISANTLSFGGSTSRIVAANSGTGNATIALANAYSNIGVVHSGDNMTFRAPSITNTATGGFSALNTLTVGATAGNLLNQGALYAGSQLTASASGNFTNASSTGTLDSGGSMSLTAGSTFTNNSTINATQDITISAPTFRNEIPGGVPARQWTGISWSGAYQTSRDAARVYWADIGTSRQYFVSTPPSTKPQIIAANNLNISGFSSAYNGGGVLSANNTMTVSGSGTFTNDALSLLTTTYTKTFLDYTDCGVFSCTTYYHQDEAISASDSTASSYGAGIFARILNASGFSLVNQGSPWATSPAARTATGVAAVPTSASATFGGLALTLPTNPNGYFVVSQNPGAKYLVETNPLFNVGSNFVGSDYMASRYGYNPDTVIKSLGDANYEAYLIRQQLISQTGSNLLKGYENEAAQMQRLMDQAVDAGKRDGFTFGTALTPEQAANLKEDIVWMVEIVVAGQKVLTPVVYLAAETRSLIETGAVIAGGEVNLDVTSLTNTGGTISGDDSLTITSKGDVTNTSGTIRGGDVAIESTEGSIKNETVTQGSGNSQFYQTTIGKTAGIEAGNSLDLTAKKNITVKGGDIKAGGDASLSADGNVTFDTIVDKSTNTSAGEESYADGLMSRLGVQSGGTTTTTSTETNIGSNLTTGGNLKIKSGGDTTIAGSTVEVGDNLDVKTGGNLNVIARQDKTTTASVSEKSGFGVGGGLYGSTKTTTTDFQGINKGSTINVGINTKIESAGDMKLQGSDLTVGGDLAIDAKSIKVLDGLDEQRSTTVTETTTFLSIGSEKETESKAGNDINAQNGRVEAGTEAATNTGESSEINFASTTVTTTKSGSNTSVASNIKAVGNVALTAKDKVTVQGSNVEAGGNLDVTAKDVEVLAGRNEEWSNTTTKTTKIGIYTDSEAGAEAGAKASATAMSGSRKAEAGAGAGAETTVTIGARVETSEESSSTLTNTSSSLKSGGNMKIKAENEAKFVGANVEAGADLSVEAENITNLAAQDETYNSSTSTTITSGLYLGGEASANASASAKKGPLGEGGKAEASAGAEVSAGLRTGVEKEGSSDGSTTNIVSTFKAGGNINRTAKNTITDQGTQLEAGGDINQTATTLKEIEAKDSAWQKESSESHDARLGVYAGGEAQASGGKQSGIPGVGGGDSGGEASAEANAGVKGTYTLEKSADAQETTSAVTTRYKAGGGINSKTTNSTTLIGTQFEAGGDVTIEAGSLDFKAARDTTSQSSSGQNAEGELKVGLVGTPKVEGSVAYGQDKTDANTSTARAGGINAGGKVNIKTQGDARLEGTDIAADGDVNVASEKGKVTLEAAKSTTTGSSSGFNVNAGISIGGGEVEGEAAGGFSQGSDSSVTNKTVNIKSGAGNVDIKAAKDVTMEGTTIDSAGKTSIEAGGSVKMLEAKDEAKSSSVGLQANAEVSADAQAGGINLTAAGSNEQKGTGVVIKSGSGVDIKGTTVVNQEAQVTTDSGTVTTQGKVENLKKTDVKTGFAVELDAEMANKGGGDDEGDGKDQTASKTTDDMSPSKPKTDSDKPRSKDPSDIAPTAKDSTAQPQTAAQKAAARAKKTQELKNGQAASANRVPKAAVPKQKSVAKAEPESTSTSSPPGKLEAMYKKMVGKELTKPQKVGKPDAGSANAPVSAADKAAINKDLIDSKTKFDADASEKSQNEKQEADKLEVSKDINGGFIGGLNPEVAAPRELKEMEVEIAAPQ